MSRASRTATDPQHELLRTPRGGQRWPPRFFWSLMDFSGRLRRGKRIGASLQPAPPLGDGRSQSAPGWRGRVDQPRYANRTSERRPPRWRAPRTQRCTWQRPQAGLSHKQAPTIAAPLREAGKGQLRASRHLPGSRRNPCARNAQRPAGGCRLYNVGEGTWLGLIFSTIVGSTFTMILRRGFTRWRSGYS